MKPKLRTVNNLPNRKNVANGGAFILALVILNVLRLQVPAFEMILPSEHQVEAVFCLSAVIGQAAAWVARPGQGDRVIEE